MSSKDKKDQNIIDLSSAKKQKSAHMNTPKKPSEPLIKLPLVTKVLVLCMIAVYFVQTVGMTPIGKTSFFYTFGFVPAQLTHMTSWFVLFSPLTYMFIHASPLHLIMNSVMLVAFGAGLEKWLGRKDFLILFFGCGLIAIFVHYILGVSSATPVIGASGATSGLFAAGVVMLRQMGASIGNGPYGLYPLIGVFVAVSIIFGITGAPEGGSVAWIAHLGGFAGGFAMMRMLKRL